MRYFLAPEERSVCRKWEIMTIFELHRSDLLLMALWEICKQAAPLELEQVGGFINLLQTGRSGAKKELRNFQQFEIASSNEG